MQRALLMHHGIGTTSDGGLSLSCPSTMTVVGLWLRPRIPKRRCANTLVCTFVHGATTPSNGRQLTRLPESQVCGPGHGLPVSASRTDAPSAPMPPCRHVVVFLETTKGPSQTT